MENAIDVFEIIKITVPSIITIIGFVVTYNLNLANITKEIYKSKNLKSSEEISEIFQPLLDLIRGYKTDNSEYMKELNNVFDKIMIYGSATLIKIATSFREFTFKCNNDVNYTFAYVGLLISQLKYDISGEYIPADTWYRYTIRDYENLKGTIIQIINNLINELELNDKLRCK